MRRPCTIALGWLFFLLLGGCGERSDAPQFEVISGEVASRNAETAEFVVRFHSPDAGKAGAAALNCFVTEHTEIYVNDQIGSLDAVEVGSAVEVIGYRDAAMRASGIVARTVNVKVHAKAPVPPDLRPPAEAQP